jgi:transcriptional regulator GlxA family with amidase domain
MPTHLTGNNGSSAPEPGLRIDIVWSGPPDPVVQRAASLLASERCERIESLAKSIGLSERHLRRRFTASVGHSPKTFQRMMRFRKLMALAQADPNMTLRELSLSAGYSDQAHMTRDVVEFAGVRPSALLGKHASALIG